MRSDDERNGPDASAENDGPKTTPVRRTGDDSMLDIVAQVQQQLDRLRSAQSEQETAEEQFRHRVETLAEREAACEAEAARLDTERHAIAGERKAIEIDQEACERQRAELEERQAALQSESASLDEERGRIEQRRRELQDEEGALAERREELAAQERHLEEQRQERDRSYEAREAALAEATQLLEARETALGAQAESLERDGTLFTSKQEQHAQTVDAFNQQKQRFGEEHAQRVAEITARATRIEIREQELDALERQLDEQRLAVETDRQQIANANRLLETEDEELRSELTGLQDANEALRRTHEQTASERDELNVALEAQRSEIETLQAQLEEGRAGDATAACIEADLAEARQELETERRRAAEFAEAMSDQATQLERGAVAIAELEAERARVAQLEARLAEAHDGTTGEADPLQVEALESEIARLQTRLDAPAPETAQQEARIVELEDALSDAQRTGAGAGGIEQKTDALRRVAQHLKRRQRRLNEMRHLLKARTREAGRPGPPDFEPDHGSSATEAELEVIDKKRRGLLEQQIHLEDLRENLARKEGRMMKRWAGPRALTTVTWFVILAVLSAAGSWLVTSHYVPPIRSATVVLEVEADGKKLSEEKLGTWQAWHIGLVSDGVFHRTLAKRMKDRRLDHLGQADAVDARLKADLTIDSAAPDEISLTLAGTDKSEITAVLDVIATTIMNESRRQATKQVVDARAVPRGGREVDGQMQHATINPVLIKDERMFYGPIVFGVIMGLCITIGVFIYRRLIRAKRVFDEGGDPMELAVPM